MQAPLSMKEAAATLSGGRQRVYDLVQSGWLRTFTIGSRRYVTRESFDQMIEAAQNGVDVLAPRNPERR